MTIISEKKEEILAELQTVVDQHNNLVEQKNAAHQRFIELNGALKTLNELEESENGREDS
jgi:chaperonin cofactor prefoldin